MKKILLFLFTVIINMHVFSQEIIQMEKKNNVYFLPCVVNGLNLKFILDTGASNVSISLTEAIFMLKNGYLDEDDILDKEKYQIANGQIEEGTKIIINKIIIGRYTLENITASVSHHLNAPLLLGQNVLEKFGELKIDYTNNRLIIGNKLEQTQSAKATSKPKETVNLNIIDKTNNMNNTNTFVLINTEFGDIKIRLYDETPTHRDNFIKLAKEGFFNGTLFHRVIKTFMIQGGDPNSKNAQPGQPLGMGDVGYRIPAEFDSTIIHKRGALAAARDGNPQKASSGCQFYIVQGKKATDAELDQLTNMRGNKWTDEQKAIYKEIGGTPFLDMNYTVFGEVVEGMDVVDKITAEPVDGNDRPTKDVKMTVKVIE